MIVQTNTSADRRKGRTALAVAAIATLTVSLVIALSAPVAAGGGTQFPWGGQGYPNTGANPCDENSTNMLWIYTGGGTPTSLVINGETQSGSWEQKGQGAWHFTTDIDATNFPPLKPDTYVVVDGDPGENAVLTLSGCDEGGTSTPTPEGSQGGGTGSPSPSGSPEGSQLGGTGTPDPSVPNSAMSLPGVAGPLATVAFGMILLASLGALAYANVRATRSRR